MRTKISLLYAMILAVLSASAGASAVWFSLANRCVELTPSDNADAVYMRWTTQSPSVSAEEALLQWRHIEESLTQGMLALSPERRRNAHRILAGKFVREGQIERVLPHLLQLPPDKASLLWDLPMFIHVAGDAEDVEWLQQWSSGGNGSGGSMALRNLAIRANVLWAKRRYEEVLAATEPELWQIYAVGEEPMRGWSHWLYLRRAMAFAELSDWDGAYAAINLDPPTVDWIVRDTRYPAVSQHYLAEMIEIAIASGRGREVLSGIRSIEQSLKDSDDVSDQVFLARIRKMGDAVSEVRE
jgi:hypothetical protein